MRKQMKRMAVLSTLLGLGALVAGSSALAQASGADIWARNCGRCHRAQPPNKYDADSWRAIMGHMALNARLTTDEEKAVTEFLVSAARPLTMVPASRQSEPALLASADPAFLPAGLQPVEGADLYQRHCAACHGKKGKGDGPAAAALTPRPTNLTEDAQIAKLNDEELLQLIATGKGSMPGFKALLKPEELKSLVEYVRQLSIKDAR